jgi:hypothetical protein
MDSLIQKNLEMLKMRKRLMPGLVIGLLILLPCSLPAQAIIGVIKGAVTKVIKAMDLEVQRIQTNTVFLQEAQKTLENAMSELDLSEIQGWVQAQKDLYGGYFQELWTVKTVLSYYHKVEEILQRQEQILASYKQAYGLFRQDPHFTTAELEHMGAVYTGILDESAKNLEQLKLVINSFSTQMSDVARMGVINKVQANMDRNFSDLSRFNNQNALLSIQRARDSNEIDLIRKLYGL